MSKILVVDDNASNRYLLEVILKSNGHEVRTANNGAEALEAALADAPDLVISDILMPVMDGFELCHGWKMNERLKTVPFIIYTATYTDPKDEELALGLGADRFVIKPQEPEVLMEIVRDALSGPRAAVAMQPADVLMEKYNEALFRKLQKKMTDLVNINRDLEHSIAERIQGEKNLKESEAKYRIVADNTYNWEFWLDPDGGFKYISPSCERITGYGCDAFIRDPGLLHRMIHPEDGSRFKNHVDGIEKARVGGNLEYKILNADGGERWIAHDCMPVYDDSGVYLGIRGSNREITEKKRLEEQLRQSQKMEAVGLLAGGIAHDFNNILTAIIGYAEMLQAHAGTGGPQREYLNELLAAAERASNLTNNLLAFGRKQDQKLQRVELNDLVRKMEKFLQKIIGEDVKIKTVLTREAVAILADSGQMEQVIMNLATNARDAMGSGGTLSIETDIVEIDTQFAHMHGYGEPGRYVMLSVSDTGAGMDEETKRRIFEPFFTTKGIGKGTGLGLSIVYGIVKQHDGFITVYTEPGRGTSFRLLFRNADDKTGEGRVEEKEAASVLEGGRETMLVVDDDRAIRNLLEKYLTGLGYTVILAEDGEDALEKYNGRDGAIDLVIMDTVMPKKNGKETLRDIRAIRPGQKVLLMSGYSSDVIQGQDLQKEGVDFILKPLRPLQLVRMAREILDRA